MTEIFDRTERPDPELFFNCGDKNDPRLGETVKSAPECYEKSEIVIVGCPQDLGVTRANRRAGAAKAPTEIRRQFYRLTPFNITRRVFDLGDVKIGASLEETHENHFQVVKQLLSDGKRAIVLGGGSDISYPNGSAMAEVFGEKNWIAINVDSHLDVRNALQRNAGTAYRQLLEEAKLQPTYFYEVGFQSHFCSPIYFDYLRQLRVHRISLELLRSHPDVDKQLKDEIRNNFVKHSSSLSAFIGFDLDVVRMADAPGTTSPSPLGLRAGEFIQLVKYAASLANTKLVEFTEVNPDFDIDDRTTKLVAIAMHRFCSGVS